MLIVASEPGDLLDAAGELELTLATDSDADLVVVQRGKLTLSAGVRDLLWRHEWSASTA